MVFGYTILNMAVMHGLLMPADILNPMAPTEDGCIHSTDGRGHLITVGAGHRFIMADGYMMTGEDGYGCRVTTGLLHGWHGGLMAAITDGRP